MTAPNPASRLRRPIPKRVAEILAALAIVWMLAGCATTETQPQNGRSEAEIRQARIEAIERLNTNAESIKKEIRIFIGRYQDVRNVGRIMLSPTDALILGQTQPGAKLGAKAREEIIDFVVRKYAEVGIDLNSSRVRLTFIPG